MREIKYFHGLAATLKMMYLLSTLKHPAPLAIAKCALMVMLHGTEVSNEQAT